MMHARSEGVSTKLAREMNVARSANRIKLPKLILNSIL
jgi:hypothetical protein